MSLSDLSTEIDEMIIQYLPHHALHNLTLTNKYYRKIAEAQLYRNIEVRSPNILSVPRLLLTLISRRELSQHIRSFAFDIANEQWEADLHYLSYYDPSNTIEKVSKDLSKKSSEVQHALKELAFPLKEPLFDVTWYYNVSREIWTIDASLALILCLATNLEHLRLMNKSSAIIETVCPARWQRLTKSPSLGVWPLKRLKSLDVALGKEASIPILAPVETLKVNGICEYYKNGGNHNFQWSYRGSKRTAVLRNLELRYIDLQPDQLHRMLELPEMHGIQHLKMVNVYVEVLGDYDHRRLNGPLADLFPSLKTFEWTGYHSGEFRPFGSFRELVQLEELTLGFAYIRPGGVNIFTTPTHLLQPKESFPDSLVALTITEMPRAFLHDLQVTWAASPSRNCLLTTARSLGLSKFDLYLDLEDRVAHPYTESIKKFLVELVSALNDHDASTGLVHWARGPD
ncbi:uncharacterized protein J4E84_010199 [Alternaria hordeiaustralica]|uniref:uncharacterized protein n=1 Tax=Alternaria hordeiaustralica TaxID=1187925 RepID=UPI0020C44AE8|nr:uncharacterized protein J4E84_010199 [Alternaria hordeiaustralica]KAI4675307.1 hypothetical protein J4E84_010199 [Alternaria hordeiaustralica]